MKNIHTVKNHRASGFNNLMRVLLVLLFAGLTCSLYADDTFHLFWYKGNINKIYTLQDQGGDTEDDVFSWEISVQSGSNYNFAISTSDSYSDIRRDYTYSADDITSSVLSQKMVKDAYDDGSTQYFYYLISFSATGTATITYTKSTNKFTITNSAAAATMYIKYPWDGSTWTWHEMDNASGDKRTFTYIGNYSGTCGADINISTDGNYKTAVSCTGISNNTTCEFKWVATSDHGTTGTLTITPLKPMVYMGKQASKDGYSIEGKVFLAKTGGAPISDIRVYYQKGSEPDISTSPYVECTGAPFVCGSQYPYIIEDICDYGSGDYYLKAVAYNEYDSGVSDVVEYEHFECCPGAITRFKLFQSRTYALPGDGEVDFTTSITGGGAEPAYKWEVKVGDAGEYVEYSGQTSSSLKYPIPSEAGGTNIYVRVTVTGSNCDDEKQAEAKLTLCTLPTVAIYADQSSVTPWKAVTLTAEVHDATSCQWSCRPAALITDASETGATFKAAAGRASDDYYYTIYLSASERHCGSVETATKRIMVVPDNDGCE